MMNEVLAALLRANLIGGAAVLAVLALRVPTRRLFGPEIAYWLWAAPPLAAFATLLPARVAEEPQSATLIMTAVDPISGPALAIWAAGCALSLAGLAWTQVKFMAAVRAGRCGPSVVGVIAPRIYMPGDDGSYTPEERALIRAHEREHVARQDPRASAFAALLQALCWFNPLVHLGAHAMRLDQELACDAAVLRRRPRERTLYAKTLLKTQLASQALPFGCYWPARAPHPLEVRIGLLRAPAWRYEGLAGQMLLAIVILLGAWGAWRVQPPVSPPPLPEIWTAHQTGPTMSVLLIRNHRDRVSEL